MEIVPKNPSAGGLNAGKKGKGKGFPYSTTSVGPGADPSVQAVSLQQWRIQSFGLRGATWRAREREPITGVWGQSPQRGPGAEPLVRGLGGRSPPEAEKLFSLERPKEGLFSALFVLSRGL